MDSLVSTDWIANELGADNLVILDATMHLPAVPRHAREDFLAGHIPSARFLDLENLIDQGSKVPKALPKASQFSSRLGKLGVSPESRLVLYDDSAIKSAARAWFIADLYGFANVAILDGGIAKWREEHRPLESGEPEIAPVDFPAPILQRAVRTKAEMIANCASCSEQVLDARDRGRFEGRDGSGSEGPIPGARNLPFPSLFQSDGTYKTGDVLRSEFDAAGVDLSKPVVSYCNSGMTAAVLLFGLHLAGKRDAALYDGSWMEWGSDPDTPKEEGPGAVV